MSKQYTAFVIMPFEPEFDAIYNDLIKPPLEKINYNVNRADSFIDQQNILKQIIRKIASADLIIAELTALNPNVFYELGLAHALRKKTILLTQSIEDLPFDLRSYRVIAYSTRYDQIIRLSESLTEIGEKAKSDILTFGNPITDFLPYYEPEIIYTKKQPESVESETSEIEENEDVKGVWDFVIEVESSMYEVTKVINRIAEATEDIGVKMISRTSEIEQIDKSGIPGSSAKMYRIVEKSASEISNYADKLELEAPKLHKGWELFAESATGLFRTSIIKTIKDKAAAEKFKDQLISLLNAISQSLSGTKEFRNAQSKLKGISRSMNRASRSSTVALDKIISEFEQAIAYSSKVIGLLEEMIENSDNVSKN